jgi:modulator of FtsH protease HflC
MNPAFRSLAMIILSIVGIAIYASLFVVRQTDYALVLRFGAVKQEISAPGLYVKVPMIDTIVTIDKRILDLDLPAQTILSADRQNLDVDAFARYRIVSPLKFYQSVNNITLANARLSSFSNSAMRNVLAGASFASIIRTERDALMNRIQGDVNRQAQALGIEIVDLRLTRVDLPTANSEAVFRRMQTERQREAADLRANGAQQAQTIRARSERESTIIVAEATRKADELRGNGEAEKNRILAEAFGRDPNFFSFYRSMQAYEQGLKPSETRLVLSPTLPFLRYFTGARGNIRE